MEFQCTLKKFMLFRVLTCSPLGKKGQRTFGKAKLMCTFVLWEISEKERKISSEMSNKTAKKKIEREFATNTHRKKEKRQKWY